MPPRTTGLLLLAALTLTACQPTDVSEGATAASGGARPSSTAAAAGEPTPAGASDSAGNQAGSVDASTGTTAARADSTGSAGNAAAPTGDSTGATGGSSNPPAGLLQVAGITDGDTIKVWINGKREPVRLLGVDTPESKKPNTAVACYAKEATSKMQSLVQSKQVRLVADPTQVDRDRYDRLVRYVLLPDGRDVSQLMIAGGFGREYTYAAAYAKQGAFRTAQSQAQAAKLGLWGACGYAAAFNPPSSTAISTVSATTPSQFKPSASPRTTTAKPPATQQTGACNIKGNINSKGEKIYHLPGQQHYADTVISPGKGERWFCSEADAQNAGWRRSKR